jgi:hypothetical protein
VSAINASQNAGEASQLGQMLLMALVAMATKGAVQPEPKAVVINQPPDVSAIKLATNLAAMAIDRPLPYGDATVEMDKYLPRASVRPVTFRHQMN